MTLEAFIALFTFIIFAICTSLILARSISADRFRYKIAVPHSFAEAYTNNSAYRIWLSVYGALFLQCAGFIAFPSDDEITINYRLIAYIFTAGAFFVLRTITLPLLTLWFGKTGIWASHGAKGLIRFEDIYVCTVKKQEHPYDTVYYVSFFAHGRRSFFQDKKYVCYLPEQEFLKYRSVLPITDQPLKRDNSSPSQTATCLLSYVSSVCIALGLICLLFSTEIFSPYKYAEYPEASSTEISSFAPITEAISESGTMIIRYGAIEAINVYSETDGTFLWSLSRTHSILGANDGICAKDGIIKYTVNGATRYFSCSTGNEMTAEQVSDIEFPDIDQTYAVNFDFTSLYVRRQQSDGSYVKLVSNPTSYILFVPSFAWILFLFGVVTLYLWRMLSNNMLETRSKNDSENEPSSDETENMQF